MEEMHVLLRNRGKIIPTDAKSYMSVGGYVALKKALSMEGAEIIQVLKDAGLRGRGGAGFPTYLKLQFAYNTQSDEKYIVCNADEGEPGTNKDRVLLSEDPNSIFEGMAIAAKAIGAHKGFIYLRSEYPYIRPILIEALESARQAGCLGKNILGSGYDFDIELHSGAGAYVCGEETALFESIEGNRGEPRFRPPYPGTKGLFGKPTILNNVETYANVPKIILQGADWYRTIGTAGSPGTKTFSLTGAIENTGLIEVPMGSTLRQIIFDIGGGLKNGATFKAVQIGGPSGGCLTEKHLDEPLDFDSVKKFNAIVGSGGMVVMDDHTCMVEVARFFMSFTQRESCGKCVPCREGTKRMLEILEKIVAGQGDLEDLDKLEELASMVKTMALCGLGKSAPLPVISTLSTFRDEYVEHIVDKKCRAKACTALRRYVINPAYCKGCGKCARNCPVNAISGKVKLPYHIDPAVCIKCGACKENCAFDAIYIEA